MRVLIVGLNYAPELVGIGPYTTGIAQALSAAGHQVEVIAAKPYYPGWRHDPDYARPRWHVRDEAGIRVTRCPLYVPTSPSGAKRLLHHLSFALAVLPIALAAVLRRRADVVVAVAPSLVATPVARLAARIGRAKFWLHVQDFEVEAAFATGLLGGTTRVGSVARAFEARQLRDTDRTSTISPQMATRLIDKGIAPGQVVEFRNWANDPGAISPDPTRYRTHWEIGTRRVALYSGNIANKQGIDIVVAAARLLRARRDLVFVICGQGPNRAALEAAAAGLPNVVIDDLQPAERLPDLLALATVHLLPQIVGATDLVLPSKLANMLASARPVVATAAAGTGIAHEVDGCGIVTPPGDVQAFAGAIVTLVDDAPLRTRLGAVAARRAIERWSRAAILARFVGEVERLAAER